MLLDLGLPDLDGVDVCRRLRPLQAAAVIVVLTARTGEMDVVVALEAGADDYLTKPVRLGELLARARAHLRRSGTAAERPTTVRLGDLVVDLGGRRVTVAGREITLRTKEFDLLAYLMENRGAVLSRDLLLERVWGYDYAGGTRTVDVHVAHLRRKLGRPDLIRTLRGSGYKAVAAA